MANKENFTELSVKNNSEVSTVGITVSNSLNVNTKRPATLQSSSSVNDDAKKQKLESPTNIDELRKFLADPDHMKQFSFEEKVGDWHGLFEIYSTDDNVSYLAFHSNATIKQMSNHDDCKIFFYYSEELLKQFQRFDVQFEGIEHVLMTFVNHKTDRISPLGIFLLPNRSKPILDHMIKVISQWLNEDGSATNVTKCTTMYDVHLQESICKTWPTAKLIGCSDEYQKDVKLFAKQNKGHTADHKELTRLACTLCYVPQMYISTGIAVIEKRSSSEYGANLVQYLRTNWIGITSVFGEDIVHRSVKVCKQFNKRMEEGYFESKYWYSSAKEPVNNIVDFMKLLRTFSKVQVIEMDLDGSIYERRRNRRFEMNTKLQKEMEANIISSFNELNQSIEALSNDETAIEKAIERFMFSIY